MNKIRTVFNNWKVDIWAIVLVLCLLGCKCPCLRQDQSYPISQGRDVIFQTSTLKALFAGDYEGDMSYQQVHQYGDFGLGTFHALDGEMIAVDGIFYKIDAQGYASRADMQSTTPFATVTFFEHDITRNVNKTIDEKQLYAFLDEDTKQDVFYAIKVHGLFKRITLRSVPKQNMPYTPLKEILKVQPTFQFENVKGKLVGFKCPSYIGDANFPGYHFHFITDDGKYGGHMLHCELQEGLVAIDETYNFFISLPRHSMFYKGQSQG